jgi:hypothetical protein
MMSSAMLMREGDMNDHDGISTLIRQEIYSAALGAIIPASQQCDWGKMIIIHRDQDSRSSHED